jgi:hypothetical protein
MVRLGSTPVFPDAHAPFARASLGGQFQAKVSAVSGSARGGV